MGITRTIPGQIVDVRPLGTALATATTKMLMRTNTMTVTRLVVPAGTEIPTQTALGEVLLQCLEGKVAFTARGITDEFAAGQLLYLPVGEPHSLRGIEDASLLLTVYKATGSGVTETNVPSRVWWPYL